MWWRNLEDALDGEYFVFDFRVPFFMRNLIPVQFSQKCVPCFLQKADLIKRFTEDTLNLPDIFSSNVPNGVWTHCLLLFLYYVFLLGVNFADLSSVNKIFTL
jgi:hypothetical protein